ncbi:HTH-type transcriptional regulator BetI [Agromyces sp. NDB4Y10]|uniref:TetR/AcrR family transcriptional regulator n=1 Tax=Agromyces sp. NDB4Y10 TaxID=1775951 RepID=UPI0007B2C400|nr:TetR family transcriptional regulator [Agromyces sp. NDB4Y10]KZE94867.1 HTH-type transcriptional regulator BetI [Agromyces sp. NDB4Y10]
MTDPAKRPLNHGDGKEALLAATVRVVATKGLRGMTFRAVADQAGVNNTLIAHHFGTRDKLLAAALEWSMERSIGLANLGEYAGDPESFRSALVENVLSEPALQVFQFEMVLESSRRPDLQPAVRTLYERYVQELAHGRSDLGLSSSAGFDRAMFAALDGLVLQYLGHAITAEQLSEAVQALGAVVAAGPRG